MLTVGLFYIFFANVSLGRATSKNWLNIHFSPLLANAASCSVCFNF